MSNTHNWSGLRLRYEQQAKPCERGRREDQPSDVSYEAFVGAEASLMGLFS